MPRVPTLSTAAGAVRASVFAELQTKIDAYRARGGTLIPLQIGDTHIAPPDGARFGAVSDTAAIDLDLYRYGPIGGMPELLRAVAGELEGRGLAWASPTRHVLIGCGATHALFCAAKVVLEPGDEVLLFAPYWPLAPGVLRACGAVPVEVAVSPRLYDDPTIDVTALLLAKLTARTAAIYLITPNNPDGKVLARADLEQIAAFAQRHGLWVFADEVYADFTYDRDHVSLASLPGMAERTISAYSFSKSHALAGARVGAIAAAEGVIAAARRIATHTVYNVPLLAQRAAVAALAAGSAWVATARADYLAARDEAAQGLEGTGARFGLAEGGAYLFVDFGAVLGERPLSVLLEAAIDEGVLLAPGAAFGEGFERHARLCYTGVPRAELREGVARLRRAIAVVNAGR